MQRTRLVTQVTTATTMTMIEATISNDITIQSGTPRSAEMIRRNYSGLKIVKTQHCEDSRL